MTSPAKKETSGTGTVSCLFASLPLVTLGLILIWDNVQALEPPEQVWFASILIGVILSPIIGLITGVVGLLQEEKSRVLPVIGTIACLTWILLVVYEISNFSFGGMPF